MQDDIPSLAQNIFKLGLSSGLLRSVEFSQVFPEEKLKLIRIDLEKDKQNFIDANSGISHPEHLWHKGVHHRVKTDLLRIFMLYLIDHRLGFTVSWDSPVEDIVYNFQTILPDLNIEDTGEVQIEGSWFQTMKIGEKNYFYPSISEKHLSDVLSEINRHLQSHRKVIIFPEVDDNDYFTVINSGFLPEFEALGFSKV